MDETTIHHFKDNKNKDASIGFYSKYDPDWQSKVNTDGLNAVSFGDDSLSKQYNVGCYPVSMQFPCPTLDFLYKIGAGHDADHQQHGGYSLYIWGEFTETWVPQNYVYIYSHQNQSRPDGRDEVNYDGQDVIDLTANPNAFVIDACNTKRWLMAL